VQLQKSIVVKNYWKAIIWNLIVILLSLIPTSGIPDTKIDWIPHMDKVIHFIMYGVLTFLILCENQKRFLGKTKTIALIFTMLYAFFLGFFLEIIQNSFLIGRNFDIFDVLANTAGILSAIVFCKIFNH